jgi:hypothetical protein
VEEIFQAWIPKIRISTQPGKKPGEILDLFEVFINCSDPSCSTDTRIYHYDADGNIGSLSANGNGYADWTLRTVDLTGLSFTNIKFHAIWNNASDGGESFFLVSGTSNVPTLTE